MSVNVPQGSHRQEHRITLDVTQDDIDNGIPMSTDQCPLSLAARRQFPGNDIDTFDDHIRIGGNLYGGRYDLGTYTNWVRAFDDAGPYAVKPFTATFEEMPHRMVVGNGDWFKDGE